MTAIWWYGRMLLQVVLVDRSLVVWAVGMVGAMMLLVQLEGDASAICAPMVVMLGVVRWSWTPWMVSELPKQPRG